MSVPIQPIAGTEIFRLFSASVGVAELTRASTEAIGEVIDGIVPRPTPGELTGRRSPPPTGLHRQDALAPLLSLFTEQCRMELARGHVQHGPLSVISCVAEQGHGGEDSAFHAVANAYLGGVYVARAGQGGCVLEFEDPRPQASMLMPTRLSADVPDASTAPVQGRAGTLVIFPGYLRHRIVSAQDAAPHLVLRMGLMFQAFAETIARPKWQGNIQ